MIAVPIVRAHHLAQLVTVLGIGAWVVLAVALARRWPTLIGWALGLFGASYALELSLRGGAVDASSVPIVAGLVLVTELAFGSLDRALRGASRSLAAWTILRVAGTVAGAALVGALILVASTSTHPGLVVETFGAAAVVGCVAVVAWAAARTRESTST